MRILALICTETRCYIEADKSDASRQRQTPGSRMAVSIELGDIDAQLAKIKLQGDRYPAHLQARVGK